MRGYYDADEPPKGGKPLQLWRWWTKLFGNPPDELVAIYPNETDRELGCASYKILVGNDFINRDMYLIWNVANTVNMTKEDVEWRHEKSSDREIWLA